MRFVLPVLVLALIAYAGLCLALFLMQRSFIYFPTPAVPAIASDPGRTVFLDVSGARLAIAVRQHAGPKAILYFGGNAEDVTGNLAPLAGAFPQSAVYLMTYRGYGASSGTPSEQALQADALALFDWVQRDHPEIEIIGRSLGTGVATYLASRRPATRLVLITPYDSVLELARQRFPYIPVRWLLLDRFESGRYAPHIRVPTLIVEAEFDEVIPHASTARLLQRFAAGVATLVVIPGAGHNTLSEDPRYLGILHGPP